MLIRVCSWCGVSILHMAPRAAYCCRPHKASAGARRQRARLPEGYWSRYSRSPARLAYNDANRERRRAQARDRRRALRAADPVGTAAQAAAWWAANPGRGAIYAANRRARVFAHPDSRVVSAADWSALVARFGGRCAYCFARPALLHADHVVPLARGGRHGVGNLLPACPPCNLGKGARLLVEWRRDPACPLG